MVNGEVRVELRANLHDWGEVRSTSQWGNGNEVASATELTERGHRRRRGGALVNGRRIRRVLEQLQGMVVLCDLRKEEGRW
jgi:hypothetical protein